MLLTAINYIDRASLSAALPVISVEFALTPAQQGLLLSSFFWTYALMQIPVGLLCDRIRSRQLIGSATLLWGAFQSLASTASGFLPLLFSRLALGVAESPIFPVGAKLNGVWLTPNERARGAALLDSGAPLGTAFGSLLITGLIAEFGSWRTSFLVSGVGTIVAGAIAFWYIRDDPGTHPRINRAEADHIEQGNHENGQGRLVAAGASSERTLNRVSIGRLLRQPSLITLFVGWSCYNTVFYGLLTWMPTYLYVEHGLDLKKMGFAAFVIFFCGFVGELTGGYLADRWRTAGGTPNRVFRCMLAIAALIPMGCLVWVASSKDALHVVVVLSVALFFLRWCGMFWSIPGLLGAQSMAGTIAGAMNFFGNIVGIVVPVLIGVIVGLSGSYFLALMFFAAVAAALLVAVILMDYESPVSVALAMDVGRG